MKFVRFLGVGGSATLIQFGLLMVFVEQLAANAVLASALAYVISAVFNYVLNYYFTFASDASHRVAALRFSVVLAISLVLNSALMYVMVERLQLHYLVAQVTATLVVLVWNFVAHRNWTYKSP